MAVKLGHAIDRATLDANRHIIKDSEMQIADNLFIAPLTDEEFPASMVFLNHSCEPNCGVAGNLMFVAMKDVKAGEELTFDYAMHYAEPDYAMDCNCQTTSCRHRITGNDWQLPELQRKYAGYFSWYIDQKIKNSNTP